MLKAQIKTPSRTLYSWDIPPILLRMKVGSVVCLPDVPKRKEVANFRQKIYATNRAYRGTKLFKTHVRPEGFFIERWR